MKKERPILFSTPMVQALLAGRKTQTRRATHDNGESLVEYKYVTDNPTWPETWKGKKSEPYTGWMAVFNDHPLGMPRSCPYGEKENLLWVREQHYRYGKWVRNGITKTGREKWKFVADSHFTEIRYSENPPARIEKNGHRATGWYNRLARFMPKSAARIWLEITDLRVERLGDISEDDAKAEGLAQITKDDGRTWKYGIPDRDGLPGTDNTGWPWQEWEKSPVEAYKKLWTKINGEESTASNPWAWAITFRILSITGKPETL